MGGASVPEPSKPKELPPPAISPTLANPAVSRSGAAQRAKAAAQSGAGFAGTVQNAGGPQGLEGSDTPTAGKSLLG
jgi:hypothetical protein